MRTLAIACIIAAVICEVALADIHMSAFLPMGPTAKPVVGKRSIASVRIASIAPRSKPQAGIPLGQAHDSAPVQVDKSRTDREVPQQASKPLESGAYNYTASETGMEFVAVKGGCYMQGVDKELKSTLTPNDRPPVYQVCISDFSIGKYEVTQAQWEQVMGDNPSNFRGSNRPVENVSFREVQKFIRKLNDLGTAKYRLPTVAEWEYAARSGGKKEEWAGTDSYDEHLEYAWLKENSAGATHSVGQKKPNSLGLYDMSGNISEWCSNWYEYTRYHRGRHDNPQGPSTGERHVIRGGAWADASTHFSSTYHGSEDSPEKTGSSKVGFRLVMTQQAFKRQSTETGQEHAAKSDAKSWELLSDSQKFQVAFTAYQQLDYPKAAACMSQLLQKHPDTQLRDLALFWLARSHYQANNHQEAARYMAQFNRQYPAHHLKNTVEEELLALAAQYN